MNIIECVKQQHRKIDTLVRQLETINEEEERSKLRVELADFLAAHIVAENEILMPLLAKHLEPGARVPESKEEHDVVAFTINHLMSIPLSSPTFPPRLRVFKNILLDHLEEEEYGLIQQLRQVAPKEELEKAGKAFARVFCDGLRGGWGKLAQSLLGAERAKTKKKMGKGKVVAGKRAPAKKAVCKTQTKGTKEHQ